MAHRIACWFLVIATLLGVPAAFAQTGVAKFRAACGQDFQRFCTGVQPGGGRIIQCFPNRPTAMAPAALADMSEAVQPPAADVPNEPMATPPAGPAETPESVPPPAADVPNKQSEE